MVTKTAAINGAHFVHPGAIARVAILKRNAPGETVLVQ